MSRLEEFRATGRKTRRENGLCASEFNSLTARTGGVFCSSLVGTPALQQEVDDLVAREHFPSSDSLSGRSVRDFRLTPPGLIPRSLLRVAESVEGDPASHPDVTNQPVDPFTDDIIE